MNSLRTRIELLIFQPPPFDASVNTTRAKDIGIQYIPIYFPLASTVDEDGNIVGGMASSSSASIAYGGGGGTAVGDDTTQPKDKSFLSYVYRVLGNTGAAGGGGTLDDNDHPDSTNHHDVAVDGISPHSNSSSSAASKTSQAAASSSSTTATASSATAPQKGGWLRSFWAARGGGKPADTPDYNATAPRHVPIGESPAASPSYQPPHQSRGGGTPHSVGGTPMSTGSSRRQRFRAYKASQEGTPMSSDGGGARSSGGYLGLGGGGSVGTPMSTTSTLDDNNGALPWSMSKRSSLSSSITGLGGGIDRTPIKMSPVPHTDVELLQQSLPSLQQSSSQGVSSTVRSRDSMGEGNEEGSVVTPTIDDATIKEDTAADITFASSGAGSTKAGMPIGHAQNSTTTTTKTPPAHTTTSLTTPPRGATSSVGGATARLPVTGRISYIHVKCVSGAPITGVTSAPTTPLHPSSSSSSGLPSAISDPAKCKYTILFSHGNADDLPSSFFYYQRLANEVQCDVVAWDYLGYGFSSGDKSDAKADCTEKNAYRAVQAVYDHMTTSMKVDPQTIIIMGRSLGSGAAVELALRLHKLQSDAERRVGLRPFAGLIVYSGLLSAASCAIKEFLAPFVPGDIMVNRKKMEKITHVPILIIHGSSDDVVPFSHGQQLYELAMKRNTVGVSMLEMDGCGHNDVEFRSAKKFFGALRRFIQDL